MKNLFALRLQLASLAVAFMLIFGVVGALGQPPCMAQCLEQLQACRNSPDPLPDCDAAYDACIEHCLGLR